MSYQDILYDSADGIATITLNRPDRLNAWTRMMEQEVRQAMGEAGSDDGVKVVVLTGAGRGFCAGADMDLLSAVDPDSGQEPPKTAPFEATELADFQTQYSYFPATPKPIVCAINGPCAGLGLVMSLYCDVRIAGSDAVFTTAFSRRGLIAEHGISWMLPRLVGHAHALDLLMTARRIDAAEAGRMGLVNQVVPQEELMETVKAYVSELATMVSPRSVQVMKRQVYGAQFQTLAQAVADANVEMVASFKSEDFKEGVAHYLEKRAPNFSGR
jgi:enoyl-CoA hydratase/carnithine racemase